MQPSLEKELRSKIRELQEEKLMVGTVILHQIARRVRACDFLDDESKEKLVSMFWEDRSKDNV